MRKLKIIWRLFWARDWYVMTGTLTGIKNAQGDPEIKYVCEGKVNKNLLKHIARSLYDIDNPTN